MGDKHPLRGSKLAGYNIFKTVVLMVKDKKHLTLEGVIQILKSPTFHTLINNHLGLFFEGDGDVE